MKKKLLFIVFIMSILVLISIGIIVFLNVRMLPTVLALSESKVQSLTAKAINDAVAEIVGDNLEYSDLVKILQDDEGKLTMLQANTQKMNQLATSTALLAQKKISDIGEQKLMIPLGTILGIQVLARMGPEVTAKIVPVGAVTSEFVSQFESAGINQTRHRIFLTLNAYVRVVIPNANQTVRSRVQVPIAESIIVGNVPNSFIDVNNRSDMMDLMPNEDFDH